MADERRTFDPKTPSNAQMNREREQGPGERQRDLEVLVDTAGLPSAGATTSENPQEDWGEPADEGAAYSANHATRGEKTDAIRGPGPKTRKATKDTISRRL